MRLRWASGRVKPAFGVRSRQQGLLLARCICLGVAAISIACAEEPLSNEAPVIASAEATQLEITIAPGPSYPYPAAMLLFNPSNRRLELVSQDGIELADMGEIAWADPDRRRGTPFGSLGGQVESVRFAYLSATADAADLFVRSATGTAKLGRFPPKALLAGSVPSGLLAVSAPHPGGSSDEFETSIFVIDPLRRTGLDDPAVEGLDPGVVPLRVQIEDDQPSGIVYCLSHSEELLVEADPCFGLYRVELSSGEVEEIVSADLAIVALSPDMRIVALASDDRVPPDVRVRNLDTGTELVFKSEAGVRDVRSGEFGPAGTRLAWVSHSQGEDGEVRPTLSLASMAGGPVTLLANASLSEAVGADVTKVGPVGWLDEARLLLELSTSRGSALYVLLLSEGRIDHIASGQLAGFVYR
ncbi:MAG TPA: hypothetical protein VJK02_23195 [Anaerolineales bacterium]|nr:hypothetical protein [Anaerolineales bacterium]